MPDNENGQHRNRGIRASREKLDSALSNSSLERKTQAALAQKIADIEELDAAPKDLVSRIFREVPVDHQSIARVARALNVEATTLYLEAPEPDEGAAAAALKPSEHHAGVRWKRLAPLAAFGLILIAGISFISIPGTRCLVTGPLAGDEADPDKLSIILAHLEGDRGDEMRRLISNAFLSDPSLASEVEILQSCRTIREPKNGNVTNQIQRVRRDGRALLGKSGADMLVWGRVSDANAILRLISTREGSSPVTLDIDGKFLPTEESQITIPVSRTRPEAGIADLKRLSIEFINPESDANGKHRENALQALNSSDNWLEASIASDKNLLQTIEPDTHPTLYRSIAGQLCYKMRLLGDYSVDKSVYEQALNLCQAALEAGPELRPRSQIARIMVNKAAVQTRLNAYAETPDAGNAQLEEANDFLKLADQLISPEEQPQLYGTLHRNWGSVAIRQGERLEGEQRLEAYERGVERIENALNFIDEKGQPLDWAHANQNICVANYRTGITLGAPDGLPYLDSAVAHCNAAREALPMKNAPLDWAMIQNNLAVSYSIRAQLANDPVSLEAAASAFSDAKVVYSKDVRPAKWAEVEANLGELHCNLARMKRDPALLDVGIQHAENAALIFAEYGVEQYEAYARTIISNLNTCKAGAIEDCACT